MEPWPPEGDDEITGPGGNGGGSTPVAFVSTQQSIKLKVDEVEDDRTPEGMICMGTYFRRRLIARSIVAREALIRLYSTAPESFWPWVTCQVKLLKIWDDYPLSTAINDRGNSVFFI